MDRVNVVGYEAGECERIDGMVNRTARWRSSVIPAVYRFGETTRNEADERVTTAYRIRAEQPSHLLVGSSRVVVGMYIDRGARDEFFNASMSGASLAEIAAILRLAIANPRLQQVIWGVDFYAFDERFVGFRHPETRVGLEGDERPMMAMLIKGTLLSLQAFDDSRKVIRRAARGHTSGLYAVPMPWPEETIRARLADPGRPGLAQTDDASLRAQLANWVGNYSEYRPSAALGDHFRRTVAGVRVTGSTSSCSCRCSAAASSRSWTRRAAGAAFQTWKRQILDAGPPTGTSRDSGSWTPWSRSSSRPRTSGRPWATRCSASFSGWGAARAAPRPRLSGPPVCGRTGRPSTRTSAGRRPRGRRSSARATAVREL
jgi:hypothetical protein